MREEEEKASEIEAQLSQRTAKMNADKAENERQLQEHLKNSRRSRRGVNITAFVSLQGKNMAALTLDRDTQAARRKRVNIEHTKALKVMENRQSEDASFRFKANQGLKWTRHCNSAVKHTQDGLVWLPGSQIKCEHERRHNGCAFAHCQDQLRQGRSNALCTFDGGRGLCRHQGTSDGKIIGRVCHKIHTIIATSSGQCECDKSKCNCECPKRRENDSEFKSRVGYGLGEFPPRKSAPKPHRASSNNCERTVVRRRTAEVVRQPASASTRKFSLQTCLASRSGPQSTSFATFEKAFVDKFRRGLLWQAGGKASQIKKLSSGLALFQASFRGFSIRRENLLSKLRKDAVDRKREQVYRNDADAYYEKQKKIAPSSTHVFKKSKPTVEKFVLNHELAKLFKGETHGKVCSALRDLGVESASDLTLLEEDDIGTLGLKKIQRKKFTRLIDAIKALDA